MGKEVNTVFKRYEKKYVLRGKQYEELKERLDGYMEVDEYGLSKICNIYYDTRDYDLIWRSIDKPAYKEKLRLRSYGVPGPEDTVFMEVKKKYDGIVYKRRIPMCLADAYESIRKGSIQGAQGQIAREIDYFMKLYKPVNGTYLAYDRIAMYGREDAGLRVTFDFRIRSRLENVDLMAGDEGKLLLPEDTVIMEIKVGEAFPFWLIHMLEEIKIYPSSFSKYGNVYKKEIYPGLSRIKVVRADKAREKTAKTREQVKIGQKEGEIKYV